MFEKLFKQRPTLARHCAGPLLQERRRFLTYLAGRGLPPNALRRNANDLLRITDVLSLARRPGENISSDEIVRKVKNKRSSLISCAKRWLRFLGRLKQEPVPTIPYAKELDAFADYMRDERCLSSSTAKNRSRFLQRFFIQLGKPKRCLRAIGAAQIDEALLRMVNDGNYTRGTVRTCAQNLRAFFRFAEAHGWCKEKVAETIRSPRTFTQASLPVGPSWNDVKRLLAMTEGGRPIDVRDRAILMLLAIYGLRSGEACRLGLNDFDWEQELLSVTCPKTHRRRIYPLIRPVGNAVLRYLREVRPHSTHRAAFLALRHPFQPLRSATGIVDRRLRRLGLCLPHYGPHILRHACATHLLGHGLTLKEIGDHLGHRHPDTTRIYAKVDMSGLRRVADFDWGGLL